MKAQLLIDKDEFNKHLDEVSASARAAGQWEIVALLHQVLTTKEDVTKLSDEVSEDNKAKFADLVKALIADPKKRKPKAAE